MKDKIIYIVIFAAVFLVVTGGIFYLNSTYKNIFAFDFTPTSTVNNADSTLNAGNNKTAQNSDSLQNILGGLIDSIKSSNYYKDTVRVQTVLDTTLIDTIKVLKERLAEMSEKNKKNDKLLAQKKNVKEVKTDTVKVKEPDLTRIQPKDSVYKLWVKKTGSLYEAMDSKKAAKIIATYSDNIAKDILYAMKKKKAAEILAQLTPETVNRITSTK